MQEFPDHFKLREFLERERRSTFTSECISAILLSLAAALGTVASYAAIYVIARLLLPGRFDYAAHLLAAVYIAAVFASYKHHDRESLNELTVDTWDGRAAWSIWIPGVSRFTNVNMLSPWAIGSVAKIITQILFAVPACVGAVRRACRKARAAHLADAASAVPFFALLLRRGKRVPYSELIATGGAAPSESLSLLLLLNVAQHLPSEPSGMVVLSTVREKLLGLDPAH